MRPRERWETGQKDLFRPRLEQMLDLGHGLVRLGGAIDWSFLEQRFGAVYEDGPGRPPLATRLMAGLSILKHLHDLSDEALCARWRGRMGEERLTALLQESLATATRTGAAKPCDFRHMIIDTTVQEKAVAFPTDTRLMHRARERLVRLARHHGVALRQSYARDGKRALIKHQRYAHARQF